MSSTVRRWIVPAAVAAGVLLLAPAAQAQGPIEILSPQRGAVHVAPSKKHALKVRARVAPRVRNLRAVVSDRNERAVTRRFRRGRGGIWTAKLRPGRELKRGPAALRISGTRGGRRVASSAHFWVVRGQADVLSVRGLPRTTVARPLDVRMRTTDRVDDVRVRVNGQGVRHVFTRTAGGRWRGALSASAGLRFGRNRITITAYDRDGVFERVSRTVRIQRGRPLPGAGLDRVVRHREHVRLDGRRSLPHRDGRMRFTWRLVRRPQGSTARLRNRHAVRPRLRADRPGIYRVRLTVAHRRARGTASAAAVQSSDSVDIAAQPATLPKGVPVQTLASRNGQTGTVVGNSFYPMSSAGGLQMVVLDGQTLELLANDTFPSNDAGVQTLLYTYEAVSDDDIVLLSTAGPAGYISGTAANQIEDILQDLGTAPGNPNGRWSSDGAPLRSAGWSVAGYPNSRTGGARALVGIQQSPDRPTGAMDGFLQYGADGSEFIFNWPSTFVQFDTHSGGEDSNFNEMTINGQTYRSDSIAGVYGSAFHLVWLDGGSLTLAGQATIPGSDGQQLARRLAAIRDAGPALLFLTTIGNAAVPRPEDGSSGDGWAQAATELARFGANANAFLLLDGSANAQYSFAGASETGTSTPNAGEDVSRILRPDVPAPRVVGLLERDIGGAWNVTTGGPPSANVAVSTYLPDIKRVLAQPDQPFPAFTGHGEPEAEAHIAKQLGIGLDPTYGIRANYWDPKVASQWSNLSSALGNPNLVPKCTADPCSAGFDNVKKQLDQEFAAVARVRNFFGSYAQGTLYQAFQDEFASSQWTFDTISNDLISRYPPQEDEASGPNGLSIFEGMLDIGAELIPEGGEALGVAAASIYIADAFLEVEGPSGYLGATVFEAQASQFASQMQKSYSESLNGLNRVADLLVSDYGRLQQAWGKVLNDWALASYGKGSSFQSALGRSIQAYMWQSLLPTTFEAYQCVRPPIYFVPESFRPAPWYTDPDTLINTPTPLQFRPFATVTAFPPRNTGGSRTGPSDAPGQQVTDGKSFGQYEGFLTIGAEIAGDFQYLGQTDASHLFGPVKSGGLGLLPAYFLAPRPEEGAPGFEIDQGAYATPKPDVNGDKGYRQYLCADNEWREDTNVRGEWPAGS